MPAEQAITIERSYRASVDEVWELWTNPKGVPLIRLCVSKLCTPSSSRWCHSPTSTSSGRSSSTRIPR
jgi:hypothetical protein